MNMLKNFTRPGVESKRDLLWFGKLENFRYFNHTSKEVKNGEHIRGEKKDGEQMHIQIIVSRKDITNKIKLSLMNTSRGKNENHSQKLGQFNRVVSNNVVRNFLIKHSALAGRSKRLQVMR